MFTSVRRIGMLVGLLCLTSIAAFATNPIVVGTIITSTTPQLPPDDDFDATTVVVSGSFYTCNDLAHGGTVTHTGTGWASVSANGSVLGGDATATGDTSLLTYLAAHSGPNSALASPLSVPATQYLVVAGTITTLDEYDNVIDEVDGVFVLSGSSLVVSGVDPE